MKRDAFFLRGALILSTLLYVVVFNWTYSKAIAPVYDYWGLGSNPTPWPYIMVSWILCMIPSFWIPKAISRPSLIFFFIQYYIIFIPASFVLYNSSKPVIPPENAFNLILLMFAGLSIIQSVYYLPLVMIRHLRIKSSIFWVGFFVVLFGLLGYMIISFGANFQLTNLEEIYSVRSALAEAVEDRGNRFGFYAQMWLAGFFLPFCFAVGAVTKRRWLVALVAGGYLLLFGIGGSKTTLFSFIYFPAIYLWLKFSRKYTIPVFLLGLCCLLSLGVFLAEIGLPKVALWYVAVVNFRTFAIPAHIIAQFYGFFSDNPLTYMSHVSGVNSLIPYPYDMDIPRLLGIYYYGTPVGLNGGFWAGDGLAGFGPPGIILLSIVCALIFWIFDSLAKRYDPRFVIITATFIGTSFGNISLSTIMLSGGLGLLFITLYFLPNKGILRAAYRTGTR